MNSNSVVMTLDCVVGKIKAHRDNGMTYDKIGALYGVGRGVIWNIEHDTEPTSYKIRTALGLEPMITPEMYNEVKTCSIEDCDVPFVPNSPLRTKCFECSPYKKRVIDVDTS
jgi:hypothetical protein